MNRARLAFDGQTSATVARRVRAQFRRCWHNAALAVSLLGPGAFYVEGWIVTSHADPFVIEHGWCEGAGRLVDPSYAPTVSPFDPPVAYFTGMRFSIKEAEAAVYRRKLPLAWSEEHREHGEAFDAAWRYATRYRRLGSLPPTRVVHCRREPSDLIIARPSKWAGPFYFG